MRNKVHDILKVLGGRTEAGVTMLAAGDGSHDGGAIQAGKAHKIRRALHKMRLRASGMTDDIHGSKEVGGSLEDPHEQEP